MGPCSVSNVMIWYSLWREASDVVVSKAFLSNASRGNVEAGPVEVKDAKWDWASRVEVS